MAACGPLHLTRKFQDFPALAADGAREGGRRAAHPGREFRHVLAGISEIAFKGIHLPIMPDRQPKGKSICLSGSGKIPAQRHDASMATGQNFIKRERERKKITQEELASGVGVSVSYLSRLENSRRTVSIDHLTKIARYLEIPVSNLVDSDGVSHTNVDLHTAWETRLVRVCGEVAAGVWREASPFGMLHDPEAELHADKYPPVPYIPDSRFRRLSQFAVRVVGPSVNRQIPDGYFAVCVPYWEARSGLQSEDLVVVERRRGGLVEGTIKRLRRQDGHWELHPESHDPRYQSPIPLTSDNSAEADAPDITAEIVGLVIGKYSPV